MPLNDICRSVWEDHQPNIRSIGKKKLLKCQPFYNLKTRQKKHFICRNKQSNLTYMLNWTKVPGINRLVKVVPSYFPLNHPVYIDMPIGIYIVARCKIYIGNIC